MFDDGKVDYVEEGGLPRIRFEWKGIGQEKVHTVWLCNFRRYGWCWTKDPKGEIGYGYGPVYANKIDGGLRAEDAEQVVRETMIRALAEMEVPDGLKYHLAVRPLLQKLLDDALDNLSEHASSPLGEENGSIADVEINGRAWVYRMIGPKGFVEKE